MATRTDETIRTTREYFDRIGAGLVKENSGHLGIVNKSREGKILIMSRTFNTISENRVWNYDSVDSMLADGWVLD